MADDKKENLTEFEKIIQKQLDDISKQASSDPSSVPHHDTGNVFYEKGLIRSAEAAKYADRTAQLTAEFERDKTKLLLTHGPEKVAKQEASLINRQMQQIVDDNLREQGAQTALNTRNKSIYGETRIAHEINVEAKGLRSADIMRMAKTTPSHIVKAMMNEHASALENQRDESEAIVQNFGSDPDKASQYQANLVARQGSIKAIALSDQVQRAQRRLGLDEESRLENADRFGQHLEKTMFKRGIAKDIEQGQHGNLQKENKELDRLAIEAADAFKKLNESMGEAPEVMAELLSSFEKASAEFKKQEEIVRQSTAAGGGGGRRLDNVSRYAMMGASGLNAVSAGVQGFGITNPMAETTNRINQVNMSNSRYTDVMSAGQGDMGALRRIMTDQYQKALEGGEDLRGYAATAAWTGAASTATAGVAKGLEAGVKTSAMTGGNAVAGTVAGVSAAAGDVVNAGIQVDAARRGIPQTQVVMSRAAQLQELMNATNMIGDSNNQAAFDYRQDVTMASRGIGGASWRSPDNANSPRNQTIELMEKSSTIERLRGLNAQERTSLLSFGVDTLGSRMGGERGVSIMEQGQRFAQAGYLKNAQQFVGMAGQLTGASGDENTLAKTLKVAISEGMTSASVMQQLVGTLGRLGEATASLGTVMSEGMASRVTSTVGTISKMGWSQEQAVSMAGAGASLANQNARSGSLSVAGMARYAQAVEAWGAPKNDSEQLEFMARQTLDYTQYSELSNINKRLKSAAPGSKEHAKLTEDMSKAQKRMGVEMSGEDIQKGLRMQKEHLLNTYFGGVSADLRGEISQGLESGKFTDRANKALLNVGQVTNKAVFSAFGIASGGEEKDSRDGTSPSDPTGVGGTQERTIEYMKDILDKSVKEGLKTLPMEIEKAFRIVASNFDPKKMDDDAKKTAETGEMAQTTLGDTFENLKTWSAGLNTWLKGLEKITQASNTANAEYATKMDGASKNFGAAADKLIIKSGLKDQSK